MLCLARNLLVASVVWIVFTPYDLLSHVQGDVTWDTMISSRTRDDRILSRKKRYLAFPEGSALQLAYCLTVPTLIPDTIFNLGWTLGANWEIPNDTRPFSRPKELSHRRDRRDVYGKLEAILHAMGMDGRSCILRALCETGQRSGVRGDFMEEILHALFKFPSSREFGYEEHLHYDLAHRTSKNCAEIFDGCESSLIDIAFS